MKDIIKLIKYTDISYMKRQIGCMIFLLLNTVLTLVYPSCISVIVDQGVNNPVSMSPLSGDRKPQIRF